MQVLLGDGRSKRIKIICKKNGFGRMLTFKIRDFYEKNYLYPGEPWALDNGAYGFWKKGVDFDEDNFLVRLNDAMKIAEKHQAPLFAVLPDIVCGGDKSLELSLSWRRIGHDCSPNGHLYFNLPNWPWYLAVQDGMTVSKVLAVIDIVDGIFLGGTNDYKKYAGYWLKLAHHHGKKFHYARADNMSRLAHAMMIGADSIDSSQPLFEKARLDAFIQALSQQHFDGLRIFSPHPEHGEGGLVQL